MKIVFTQLGLTKLLLEFQGYFTKKIDTLSSNVIFLSFRIWKEATIS